MICKHCSRRIEQVEGVWIDPEATGDDSVWRETCDRHDTFVAEHEPTEEVQRALLAAFRAGIKQEQDQHDFDYHGGKTDPSAEEVQA